MLMRDMDKAVERVKRALKRRETIAVYGDYDVDGITSTCLLTEFLTGMGAKVIPYIPGRLDEGYGLNREAVTTLARQGVKLLITVDCGITAVDEVAYANRLGIDVVVTDHHTCKEELPAAVAVVDPHREDCPYPFKGLAGVGVALKLAMAVAGPERAQWVFQDYCDLAAIGSVADVMPMEGENRAIVSRGLALLYPPRRLGLASLLACAGLEDKPVSTTAVGYTLAPRINASGRMGQAEVAAELLLTHDEGRAGELAQQLCDLNRERQAIEGEILQQSLDMLAEHPQEGIVLLASEGWHQGVVGIVASRLAEKFACPTFMVCLEHGMGKGSCRSWGGVNLFDLLRRCAPLLESFGGHALAAGFTVREENIPALAAALRQALAEECRGEAPVTPLEIDAAVTPAELTVEQVEALDLIEPFGPGNPRPLLVWNGAQVQTMSQVGHGKHLKLRLEARGAAMEAIFFSADGAELGLYPGCRVDVAFYPQINEFRGVRSVQLQVVDLRPAPTRAQMEQDIYDRFHRGELLTAAEAQFLLPTRGEFVELWRWLERQSISGAVVEDTLPRIAKSVSRSGGQREVPARTLFCLDVLEERGLICLRERTGRLQITLNHVEHKVDLDASQLLRRLRELLEN
jgi:single-stranded-DNA-specific exonuclease